MSGSRQVRQPGWIPGRARGSWRSALLRIAPGLALCVIGVAMLWLARGQPAWLGGNVGPGLLARVLGKAVVALGALWALWLWLRADPSGPADCGTADQAAEVQRWSGPALLGAVLVFALALPPLGLVVSATLAAAMAAIGAGERGAVALGLTVAGLAALTAGIGVTLLPPTAPLWPAF